MLAVIVVSCSHQTEPYVNEVDEARSLLEQQRTQALTALDQGKGAAGLKKLVELGLWDEAQSYLNEIEELDEELKLVQAQLFFRQHRYDAAETLVAEVLDGNPGNREARLLQADLYIQAWKLQEADRITRELLKENGRDAEAGLLQGRIALFNRDYDKALEWAEKVQDWDSGHAGAYLLEADSRFWAQDPAGAEAPLVRALELNPFDPDARFSYGYAIWRRVDATQLQDMADQWNLAFEVNPLHYLTHWHYGNGHTNLTYADYAHPSDSLVRARVKEADQLVTEDRLDEAIAVTRKVEAEYPESVLPAMMRGSIFYMYYDMDRVARLDSAQAIFEAILQRKHNYGPAHNGLAAVIKQRQVEYLDGFNELEKEIEDTQVPTDRVFYEVFPDADYYPGDRVKKMIAQQIGPSKAYLPLINKFNSDFAIPPLHVDLAEAMDRNYFRYGTTFDNRQWMDIRGVGSGATGIEYLERGAYWERNVLAHEYAHLYHGRILTDRESRRIRALYYAAMENNRTLDYYASNNESEFFAQGYAGFLSTKKVHPLNHKSMNTRKYIQQRDPEFYAFLDSLLQKQQEYLEGNEETFDDNWAQTYLTLAERSRQNDDPTEAQAHLDTALSYSAEYIPALLEYAEVKAEQGNFAAAEELLDRASALDESYAPLYTAQAYVVHEKALQGILSFDEAMEMQVPLFEQAAGLESDLAERARINREYRERLRDYGQIAEAVRTAERYLEDAPVISTYLRDRKDEAEAYASYLRSSLGYSEDVASYFKKLVDQKPQHFEFRLMYADVLMQAGSPEQALKVLEAGQRILAAANNERTDYILRMARAHLKAGNAAKAGDTADEAAKQSLNLEERLMLAEIFAGLDRTEEARSALPDRSELKHPLQQAEWEYRQALIAGAAGEAGKAVSHFERALQHNPFHLEARAKLISILEEQGQKETADQLRSEADELAIPAGPDFYRL